MTREPVPPVDVEAVGRRVEALLDEVAAAEPAARHAAEELVRELLGLYGAALERIVAVLHEAAPARMEELINDELVAGLLLLHGLHPLDVRARVEAAVEAQATRLGAQVGEVAVVAVDGEVVRLRIAADGCASSGAAVRQTLEEAVRAAAPEVSAVVVVEPPERLPNGLIPPSALTMRPGRAEA